MFRCVLELAPSNTAVALEGKEVDVIFGGKRNRCTGGGKEANFYPSPLFRPIKF